LLLDKGILEFVEAAELAKTQWPGAEFWVVGGLDDGNPAHIDRTTLLEWVQRGIIWYKGVTADVRPFIAQSDWVVLPSYREGLSRVLLEAMAMARPIITSDAAGCRETVEHGKNGFLVPVKDAGALADQIRQCCDLSKAQTAGMGAYGREKVVQEFEQSLVGKHYLNIVTAILKNNKDS
jgi:glycosyltransferase involved in cell wall biosynthesis